MNFMDLLAIRIRYVVFGIWRRMQHWYIGYSLLDHVFEQGVFFEAL